MKYLYLLICALLCRFITPAQEIVTHGFVNYTLCPDTYSQIEYCTGWRQPTLGTSDYFNACAMGTDVGVPANIFGFQDCLDSAYAGLYTYVAYSVPDYKEYIGTTISPLIVGHTYTMSIRVSLSDNSSHGTDGLGVFFSTYLFSDSSIYSTVTVTPQVDYSSYGTITDKTNWVTLSKTFVADSAYTNLIVGGFKPVGIMHTDSVSEAGGFGPYSYYYISRIGIPDSTREVIDTTTYVDTTGHTDTIKHVTVVTDTAKYVFPTGFTPNGDGRNDVFRIITRDGAKLHNYCLSIFNRWGQRVYRSYNTEDGWDGYFNGVPQEIGAYFYLAEFSADGQQKIAKGDFTLVR